jgi:hypothetical protein
LDFAPFVMAHDPLKMTIAEARAETNHAWTNSYSPQQNARAVAWLSEKPLRDRISHLVARLFFRGIYFPQMGWQAWLKVVGQNRHTIMTLAKVSIQTGWKARKKNRKAKGGKRALSHAALSPNSLDRSPAGYEVDN